MSLHEVVLYPFVGPRQRAESTVLLADHRGAGLSSLHAELAERGCTPAVTHGLGETLDALRAGPHRALVLDPAGVGGIELEELVRAAPGLPVVLLVDPAAPDAGLETLEAREADPGLLLDHAHRGIGGRELALRVRALERAAAWRHRASHDERTECLRPEAFDRRLVEQASASRRHGFPLALALLDLDDFGRVNKRHDHTVGDRVITRVGEVLRRTLRSEDLAGRVGGDEFALALPYTGAVEAEACARRVLAELAHTPVAGRGGVQVAISASAGLAVLGPGEETPLELVRRRAEVALRAAKHQGGGACVMWSERQAEGALSAVE
jgi:diguanylate cyclase (GGDEF)-like protein